MERKICTKENPMPDKDKGFWQHPDAIYIKDKDKGDYDVEVYTCPNCKLTFEVELPD